MPSEEMKAVLELSAGADVTDHERLEDRRAAVTAALHGPLADGTAARATSLAGRPALWIEPTGGGPSPPAVRPAVLYLHGGVFEVGSPSDYQAFCSLLALRLGAAVVALDYRLAPEHRFPAAVDDCLQAYAGLLADRPPARVALVGDSAGGGLVVSCLLAARSAGLPQPAAAVGISSWADLTQELDAHRRNATSDPFIRTAMLDRAAAQYLDGADPRHPLASPVHAPAEDLAGLAPLLLLVAGNEVLADDSIVLAGRTEAAGGDVTLEVCPEAVHAWLLAGDAIPESRDALDILARFVRVRLEGEPDGCA